MAQRKFCSLKQLRVNVEFLLMLFSGNDLRLATSPFIRHLHGLDLVDLHNYVILDDGSSKLSINQLDINWSMCLPFHVYPLLLVAKIFSVETTGSSRLLFQVQNSPFPSIAVFFFVRVSLNTNLNFYSQTIFNYFNFQAICFLFEFKCLLKWLMQLIIVLIIKSRTDCQRLSRKASNTMLKTKIRTIHQLRHLGN